MRRLLHHAIVPVACLSGWLCVGLRRAPARADEISAPIVNGTLTSDYPTAGALLILSRVDGSVAALCSGTLIGCTTFLTAAHCVCPDDAPNAATCMRAGVIDPSRLLVFFQHAGFFSVATIAVDPSFDLQRGDDAAVLHLAAPVTGIAGSPLNRDAPVRLDTLAPIVGFGRTGGNAAVNVDAGSKRWGEVQTAACTGGVPGETHICWNFLGENSTTCQGDSGGPLFIETGAGQVIAGIHAGGTSETCLPRDMGFDTSVYSAHDWISAEANGDLPGVSCGGLPAVGTPPTAIVADAGELSPSQTQGFLAITVPPGSVRLRITLNGQIFSVVGATEVRNNFDLSVARLRLPTSIDSDCRDLRPGPFGACEFDAPASGSWYAVASQVRGSGTYQLTATIIGRDTCRGDCGGEGVVTVDDLIIGVNIALELESLAQCPEFAAPGSDSVTIDDILVAVNNALDGCPSANASVVANDSRG
jgi:hypothetical protein